ncbi:MAG: hypothetical protein VB102_00610 [Paludibacter sp.]|nr:hypothetical protein [Paludibacter sp.]
MLLDISYLEWIGYISSVLVAVSLTMSSIIKLRWFNMVGAAIFSFYGFAIGSLPVGLLNLFIVMANIYYLSKIYTRREIFKLFTTDLNDGYVKYYLNFNKKEIAQFFPDYEVKMSAAVKTSSELTTILLLRDALVAGIFIGLKKDNELHVLVDYVSAPYRDMKAGDFIYKKHLQMFREKEIDRIVCTTTHPLHKKYLEKMGFLSSEADGEDKVFVKVVSS